MLSSVLKYLNFDNTGSSCILKSNLKMFCYLKKFFLAAHNYHA